MPSATVETWLASVQLLKPTYRFHWTYLEWKNNHFQESPVPEVSCNSLIARDLETGNFPVVTVEFDLDNSAEALEEFPEDAFREKISSSLRVDEVRIDR